MGTWDYEFLSGIPAAENSLARMAGLLAGPLCGWPGDRLLVLGDERGPGDLADRLITAFDDVQDVALFYYVGHGQLSPEDDLCLALGQSRPEAHRRAATSLRFSDVRRALLESAAATRIVILDCCFAGLATSGKMAGTADGVLDLASGTGAYTMAATGAYATAWYEDGPGIIRPQTYFTKYLVDLVEAGIPGQPPWLGLEALFRQLRDNLAADRRPLPSRRAVNDVRDFAFAHNIAGPQVHRGWHSTGRVAAPPRRSGPLPPKRRLLTRTRTYLLAGTVTAAAATALALALPGASTPPPASGPPATHSSASSSSPATATPRGSLTSRLSAQVNGVTYEFSLPLFAQSPAPPGLSLTEPPAGKSYVYVKFSLTYSGSGQPAIPTFYFGIPKSSAPDGDCFNLSDQPELDTVKEGWAGWGGNNPTDGWCKAGTDAEAHPQVSCTTAGDTTMAPGQTLHVTCALLHPAVPDTSVKPGGLRFYMGNSSTEQKPCLGAWTGQSSACPR